MWLRCRPRNRADAGYCGLPHILRQPFRLYRAETAAVLLLIGAAADLQISHFLYNPGSMFGKLFEAIGEFPASYLASLCAMIIAFSQNISIWKRVSGAILTVLLSLMAGMLLITYQHGPKALGLIAAAAVLIANAFLAKTVCKNGNPDALRAAKLGLQLFVTVLLLFNLIKLGWGRERYRHMVSTGDFSGFSMWMIPQGLVTDNEFMSFPSGHSANAAVIMWLTLLPDFVPALSKRETLLKIFAILWIGCVMLSRIIMGAHFLSDVTMGMTLSLLIFYVFYQRLFCQNGSSSDTAS